MRSIRPRRFHRVCHRSPNASSQPSQLTLQDAGGNPELARQQITRLVACSVLALVACGPIWVAGSAVVEMYRDEQVRKTPLVLAPDRVRMFSQKETRTLALLAALTPLAPASAAGNPLNDAGKETAFRGISLDLASSYLPSQETQLSLLAPATQDALALGGDRALPLARLEGFSDSPFTALADTSAIAAVPEPSAWSMLTLGVAGTLVAAIRRRLFS